MHVFVYYLCSKKAPLPSGFFSPCMGRASGMKPFTSSKPPIERRVERGPFIKIYLQNYNL